MVRRGLACAVVLVVLATTAARARADARVRNEAVSHYEADEFAAAAGVFATVFVQERDPADLFAWAQSERMWGKCDRAVKLYSLFLSFDPPAANREAASRGFDLCNGEVDLELTRLHILETDAGRTALDQLLQRGYALSGNPWFLYAVAVLGPVERRCVRARELLERAAREAASVLLEELVAAEASHCVEPDVPEPPPAQVTRRAAPPRAWYRDPWGGALVGSGVAALAAGGILFYVGHSRIDGADRSTYGVYASEVGSGTRLRTIGAVSLAAGAVLTGLGIWRYRAARHGLGVVPHAEAQQVGLALCGLF